MSKVKVFVKIRILIIIYCKGIKFDSNLNQLENN